MEGAWKYRESQGMVRCAMKSCPLDMTGLLHSRAGGSCGLHKKSPTPKGMKEGELVGNHRARGKRGNRGVQDNNTLCSYVSVKNKHKGKKRKHFQSKRP